MSHSAHSSLHSTSSGFGHYSDERTDSSDVTRIPLQHRHKSERHSGETSDDESDFSLEAADFATTPKKPRWPWFRIQKWRNAVIGCSIALVLVALYKLAPRPEHYQDEPVVLQEALSSTHWTRQVVLASYSNQDVGWTKEIPQDWTVLQYLLPEREHYTYLHHITANYNNLSDYTVFLHGHAQAWHQIEPAAWKTHALNITALEDRGYISLRCALEMGCTKPDPKDPEDDTTDTYLGRLHEPPSFWPLRRRVGNLLKPLWKELLQPYGFGDYPDEIAAPCCAQFAVSKAAIRAQPLEFWQGLMRPLKEDEGLWKDKLGARWNLEHSGNVYEYLWHVVFGRPAVDCGSEDTCRMEFFSDSIHCDRMPGRPYKSGGFANVTCTNDWSDGVWPDVSWFKT